MRTPGVTLDTDELERELGATDELERELGATDDGTELEVVGTLELLGRELELLHAGLGPSEQLLPKLLEEDLLEGGIELEEDRIELEDGLELELGTTLLDDPPTIFVQVEREIQLLLFSQPQPLWVVTHNG